MAKVVHRGQWQIEILKSKIQNMGLIYERAEFQINLIENS
jgi:hypothetical protein